MTFTIKALQKLGEKMYEYYPNMVLRLKVPLMKISEEAIAPTGRLWRASARKSMKKTSKISTILFINYLT